MHLLLVHQILIRKVKVHTIDSDSWLTIVTLWHVALSIEGGELRLVLDEIILAVLQNRLVAETTDAGYSFAFWLSIFISVFHFLFSLVHVTWSDGLIIIDLTVERSTKHILRILYIKPRPIPSRLLTIRIILSESSHEKLIHLLVILVRFSIALNVIILLIFLVGQIKACTISHMHLKWAWGKTLGLLLVDASNLFLRVAHWTVVLLGILLHKLVLKKLLILLKLLTVTGDARLGGVDGTLHCSNHVQKVRIIFWVSDIVKPWMLESLLSCDSFRRIHL